MALIPNVIRRGAIYYWRRRLPQRQGCSSFFVSISLKTADSRIARRRSARLTAVSHDLFEYGRQGMLTDEQVTAIMRSHARENDEYLAGEAALDRMRGGRPAKNLMGLDPIGSLKVLAEFCRRRATPMGVQPLADAEKSRLRKAEWSERMITVLDKQLDLASYFTPIGHELDYLRKLAEDLHIEPAITDIHLSMIDAAALRGKAAAYDKHARALSADPDEDYDRAFGTDLVPAEVLTPRTIDSTPSPSLVEIFPTVVTPVTDQDRVPARRETLISTILDLTVEEMRIAREAKGDEKGWSDDTIRQATAIIALLVRYLRDVHGIVYFEDLEQRHLDGFNGILKRIAPNHGKANGDADLSATDYIRKYVECYEGKARLKAKTRNKYWSYISQLCARAKTNGIALRGFEFGGLRTKLRKGDPRKERPIPELPAIAGLFLMPPFTGCAGWNHRKKGEASEMFTAGPYIFHRAAYYGPLFAHYHGPRRNEFCSLAVDDIVEVDGIWCFKIRENQFGTIKNEQSERLQAIHPELIRLGFLLYVAMIKALGYKMVFPDLVSPSSNSSLGDRLYDELLPGFRQSGFTPHQMRHFFNNDLKQKRVSEEIRQDFLGQLGGSEASKRYADALYVRNQLVDLLKVTNVTRHLEPRPIKLLPWVEKKQTAPWSFQARGIRRKVG